MDNGDKFSLGEVVATPGALAWCERFEIDLQALLQRHASGDWGDLEGGDRAANDNALASNNGRLLSSYRFPPHGKLWIITEWNRSITTVLLPSEY